MSGQRAAADRRVGPRDVLRLLRGHRRRIAGAVLLMLSASALGLAQPLLVKRVIEAASAERAIGPDVTLLVVFFLAQAVVQGLAQYALTRTGEGIVLGIRIGLIRHLLRLPMRQYDRHRVGDLISRVSSDSTTLRLLVAEGFTDAVTGGIGLIGVVALMIWLDWLMFLIVLAVVALATVLVGSVLRGISAASLVTQQATGAMTADLERALGAIRTVRASRAEQREADRIGGRARSAYAGSVRMARLDAVVAPAVELAVKGSFVVVLLVGGMRVAGRGGSVADLAAFLLYMVYLIGPIGSVFQSLSTMEQGVGAYRRVTEVMALPVERETGPGPAPEPRPGRTPLLAFRDVWFAYDADRPVLRGVTFEVPEHAHVALIGTSGVGKSTVFALIERFYDPDRGRIEFDGRDIRTVGRSAYRARIGLVEQQAPVLYGTLRENLTYAVPDATPGEVDRVVERVHLTDLVSRLPRGLDTDAGDRGVALSGGERQRIAIARSLLARPRLLLLDEPTAHLDAVSEAALRRSIRDVSAQCTLLVIAHRMSTVRAADLIVVLDGGRVVATGSHEQLVAGSEHYRRLLRAQQPDADGFPDHTDASCDGPRGPVGPAHADGLPAPGGATREGPGNHPAVTRDGPGVPVDATREAWEGGEARVARDGGNARVAREGGNARVAQEDGDARGARDGGNARVAREGGGGDTAGAAGAVGLDGLAVGSGPGDQPGVSSGSGRVR
ncbi:ABC transporter ATP-binding protein [Streptomyces capillispiralis]|uniref:ATP-binding cassette subfamily B protein n=1 Tax=Streptomyces capillispiralis TaxID=68182 RepID=A0A561TJW7_9ACTN|nr:ABC transporter ATP-binding protein [Streptomyces capillispiralis]TWF87352.1 ATP-binding cassette subfamily B protein [Streptomyces capillispiralis]GHH92725.1 ABC transporter [Streptomyces capillispiralis]